MVFVNCSQPSAGNTTCSRQPIGMGNGNDMTFNIQTQDPFGNASAPPSSRDDHVHQQSTELLDDTSGHRRRSRRRPARAAQITLASRKQRRNGHADRSREPRALRRRHPDAQKEVAVTRLASGHARTRSTSVASATRVHRSRLAIEAASSSRSRSVGSVARVPALFRALGRAARDRPPSPCEMRTLASC